MQSEAYQLDRNKSHTTTIQVVSNHIEFLKTLKSGVHPWWLASLNDEITRLDLLKRKLITEGGQS